MKWQRALEVIHEHGFTWDGVAEHLGVYEGAVDFWLACSRPHTKNKWRPLPETRAAIVDWALALLSGAAPRPITVTLPDGTVREEVVKVLPFSGGCPLDEEKMRRRREALGFTHEQLALRVRNVLRLGPPPPTRDRTYENLERGVVANPQPARFLAAADALFCGDPLEIQPDDIREQLEDDRRAYEKEEATIVKAIEEIMNRPPAVAEDDVPKVIAPEEVEAILSACSTSRTSGRRNRAMLEVMYLAGLRVSEACDLVPDDVKIGLGGIPVHFPHIHIANGKGGRARNVPCGPRLYKRLHTWARERDPEAEFFFHTGSSKQVMTSYMRQVVDRLCERAGIDPLRVSPHTFRHCYATERIENDYTVREVQQLLGHKSLQSTMVYLHVRNAELVGKVNADANL